MKREIKFRAWDSETKIMHYSNRKQTVWAGGLNASIAKEGPSLLLDDVMQFTGLHDRNGKEIYEGDIVQRGIIIFQNGKFQGNYYEDGGGLAETWEDDLYQEKDIEVLGNIFENPELIK